MSARQKNIIVSFLLALMALQVVGPAVVDFFQSLNYQYQHYCRISKEKLEKVVVPFAYWKTHLHQPKRNEIIVNGEYFDVKSFTQKGNDIEFIAKKDKSESVFVFFKNKISGHFKTQKIPFKTNPPKYAQLFSPPVNRFDDQLISVPVVLMDYYKNVISANYAHGVFHPPAHLV